MTKHNFEGHSEGYKAKLCIEFILQFLREQGGEDDSMGEGGTSTKEYRLVDFQKRVGAKTELEDGKDTKEAIKKRRQRARKKAEKNFEEYRQLLSELRNKYRDGMK